jgi:putative ABC transport system ATP-binding protein
MMELQDVAKSYPQGRRVVHALRGVSLKISAGEFVSIVGPSGSGKSTLMHLLGALDVPTSGRVWFDGRDLETMSDGERSLLRRNRIGFIFQFFNLLPTLTAVENVSLPLMLGGAPRKQSRDKALAGLQQVGLALVTEPEAILCDEPTGNLDSVTSKEILTLLRGLPEAGRRSVVMVTHDPQAAQYGDRLITIRDGLIESEEMLRDRTVERHADVPGAQMIT